MVVRQPLGRRSRAALQSLERGESVRTIVIALVANLVIAIAKLIAGLIARSTGMLAEAAHSFADTLNEVLLAFSLHRARQPPDAQHPLGHGREQFLWALMAAIASFLIGGCVSAGMAIHRLTSGGAETGRALPAWIVLGVSFIADGTSFLQSVRQGKREAAERGHTFRRQLLRSSDPVVRAIVFEDAAALIGLVLATIGLAVTTLTGSSIADSIASLLIGILLAVTAFVLARPLADFLVGRSLAKEYVDDLHRVLTSSPAVEEVLSLQAVYIGPREVIVAAKLRPSSTMSSGELAQAMDELDAALRKESPFVADVYLDLTTTR